MDFVTAAALSKHVNIQAKTDQLKHHASFLRFLDENLVVHRHERIQLEESMHADRMRSLMINL